jgi:uncharacterized phiE125 gp8 family phage protein
MVTLTDLRVVDTLIEGPMLEPIDLDEVKKALKFTPTSEDTLLDAYISAARQSFEEVTGIQIMAATRERRIYGTAGGPIELPYPPLLEVVSATYGTVGDETALVEDTDFALVPGVGTFPSPGFLRSLNAAGWMSGAQTVIRYRCGFGTQRAAVPELVKVTLYQMVASFHKFRASVQDIRPGAQMATVPFVDDILKSFKYHALPVYPVTGTPPTWV